MSLHSDIQTRGSSFYFRKAIPADIRPHFGGKREIIRSLGKDAARAKVEGRELSLQIERLFLTAREKPEAVMQAKVVAPTDRKRAEKRKANAEAKPVAVTIRIQRNDIANTGRDRDRATIVGDEVCIIGAAQQAIELV